MNQKTRNESYLATQNSQLGIPSVSLITHDEFYGNQVKQKLDDHNPESQIYQTPNNKNNQRKGFDLKHKNMKILQELKEISDQLQTALERQKIQQKQSIQYSPKDTRIAQEQQEEIDKAFSILNLQKRDIELLEQQIQHIINNDKRVEDLNQLLIEKNKEIKALEHEKNYLNKVLGNVDKIMKAEGVKDQKLQQVHTAYKEEIRLLKERIRELENIQRLSEKNAMKLHQHYMDLDEKYKQALSASPSIHNKSPNKYRNAQAENNHIIIESIKNDYEDKIQTYIQKLRDKENETKSLSQQLQKKEDELNELKVLVREYEIQIQREQRDKEMIESYNKNLREQLKIQAQKLSQESISTVQQINQSGKEIIKVPTRQPRTQTPKKDIISPQKYTNTYIRKDQKPTSNSLEKSSNKINHSSSNNNNDEIKIYKRDNSSSIKRKNNGYINQTMSMEIQHSRENIDIDLADKLNQSVFNDNQNKYSTPGTPQKKMIIKRQLRSPSINNSDSVNNRYNYKSTDRRETAGSVNNSNIFSTNSANNNKTIKKQNLFSSKLSTKDNEDLVNQLHPLSARNRIKELQKTDNLVNSNSTNKNSSPTKDDNNIIIETPYVRTLNSKYLALKSNQNDGKSPIKTELSVLLEKKQKNKLDLEKSPQQKQQEQEEIQNNNSTTQQQSNKKNQTRLIPSDISEQDLNHTFTQFQKEVSQVGLDKFLGNEQQINIEAHRSTPDLKSDKIKMIQKSNNFQKENKDGLQIKQQSIGKVQPHNQIMFSDYEFISSQNPSEQVSVFKIVGARFWLFKPTNKIMGLQMQYLTNQNKLIWGPANVHIFTSNISVQTINLASNFKDGDDPYKLDYVSLVGCRYNNDYSYIENIIFITNSGVVYNFGKLNSDPKQQLLTYFDIDSPSEVPFSIFGSISKEYDPMSGTLVGTKLSYFGCQVANIDQLKSKDNQQRQSQNTQSFSNLNPPINQLDKQYNMDQSLQSKSNLGKNETKARQNYELSQEQKENVNIKQTQNQKINIQDSENQKELQNQNQQKPQQAQQQIIQNELISNPKNNDNNNQTDLQNQMTATFCNQNNNSTKQKQQAENNPNNQNLQQQNETNNNINDKNKLQN